MLFKPTIVEIYAPPKKKLAENILLHSLDDLWKERPEKLSSSANRAA